MIVIIPLSFCPLRSFIICSSKSPPYQWPGQKCPFLLVSCLESLEMTSYQSVIKESCHGRLPSMNCSYHSIVTISIFAHTFPSENLQLYNGILLVLYRKILRKRSFYFSGKLIWNSEEEYSKRHYVQGGPRIFRIYFLWTSFFRSTISWNTQLPFDSIRWDSMKMYGITNVPVTAIPVASLIFTS